MYKEFDTWYGAKFSENIELIPDGIVHLRPPLDLDNSFVSLFFNNTYSLDIKWSTKGKIKTFQSEEFKTEDVFILHNRNIVYPVRYVHAEFDLDTKNSAILMAQFIIILLKSIMVEEILILITTLKKATK